MPKRSSFEKLNYYKNKIKRLEERENRRHRTIPYLSDSENNTDNEPQTIEPERVLLLDETEPTSEQAQDTNPVIELDPEIVSALGETTDDSHKFGEKIHLKLPTLWNPILIKGIEKEAKEKLLKQYMIPENCTLLQAPKLNPEIYAAISEVTRFKDKRVEAVQQQLGVGISALSQGLSLLLEQKSNEKRVDTIKILSDSCRILCDLHHTETQARIKFVTPGLEKAFLNIIQDVERDEMLFSNSLAEKIKASKAIEKQVLQIKKPLLTAKPPASATQSSARARIQGNWNAPPRYPTNRGGRGGQRPRPLSSVRRPQTNYPPRQTNLNRTRAPAQHQ